MRLAFLGTPAAAVPSLRALVEHGHDVATVVTRPDRRRRRGGGLEPSPVKAAALELGLRVVHRLSDLEGLELDRGIVVAYGAMIPADVLTRTPMLNVHFSLLPRWRGAAPVQRAILAGDRESGVSIISLEPTLDTGPVHLERRVEIGERDAATLTNELALLGAAALVQVLGTPSLLANPTAQRGETTYAEKITKESLRLRPFMGAILATRTVRLGGAWLEAHARRLGVEAARVVEESVAPGRLALVGHDVVAGTDEGAFRLERVRPEGSRSMSATSWWAGLRADPDGLSWS